MTTHLDLDQGEEVDTDDGHPRRRERDKRPIKFDGTISLGTILSLGAILFGGTWFMAQQDSRGKEMDDKLSVVQNQVGHIADTLDKDVNRIDARIDGILQGKR